MSEVVTAEQIEAFRTNGFIVVDDLLTDAELDTFEPLVTAAVAYRSGRDERTLEEPSTHTRAAIGRWAVSAAHDVTCGFSQDPPAKMPGEGRTNGHPFQRGVWGDGD